MFYDVALTIPANTPETDPAELDVQLTHGVITHVEVEFAPGCHGLVAVYIRQGLHQVWPTNPDSKFASDGQLIRWDDYHELFDSPYVLTLGGYSLGTTYDHQVIFRFELTPKEVAERGMAADKLMGGIAWGLGLVR